MLGDGLSTAPLYFCSGHTRSRRHLAASCTASDPARPVLTDIFCYGRNGASGQTMHRIATKVQCYYGGQQPLYASIEEEREDTERARECSEDGESNKTMINVKCT